MLRNYTIFVVVLSTFFLSFGGCDFLLRILQREMVEEKELFGDIYRYYGYNVKVEELQKMLKEVGYNLGSVDGKMGYRTRGAIKEFQKNYGLKATGYVDKKTWVTLNRIYKTDFISREKIDVRYIQIALKNAGFNPGPIDGKMGPKTEKAIREFQKAKVLVPDGLVGPKTWNELREYIKK